MWSVRICTKAGDRMNTREVTGFATKAEAYGVAMTERKATAHSPIYRDGHCYIVFAN